MYVSHITECPLYSCKKDNFSLVSDISKFF